MWPDYDRAHMGATATLGVKSASVQPGGEASCEIRIRNSGTVVDQFTLEVLGDAAGWAIVEPPSVSLFPGAEAVARIRFKPPKSPNIPARAIPFAVRVKSREDARASMVEEGIVEVGAFTDTFAELIPRTARGARRGRAQLALDNRGNVRINVRLTASDPDKKLNFAISPPGLVAEPGTASFAHIRLIPRQTFFTGPPKTLPYKVFVHQDGVTPQAVDGVMIQEGLLPKWLLPALIGLVALVLAATLLWFLVLRPTLASTAKEAVATQAAQASSAAVRAETAAAAVAAGPQAAGGGGGSGPNPLGGDQVFGRITATEGADGSIAADPGKPFGYTITDLVFENPSGSSGSVKLIRGENEVLFEMRLENFRDFDLHFVTPLKVVDGQKLTLRCTNDGQGCSAAVSYSGYRKRPA
jgi:hypothetical protein